MIKFRLAHLSIALAALGFTAATPMIGLSSAVAAEALRPEIGKPLQQAQTQMKQGNHKGALATLRDADKVGNKTANESYLIERVRASAASSAGDYATAAKSFEALLASGKLSAAERSNFAEGLVGIYMRAGDLNKANETIQRLLKDKDDPKLRAYLLQNYYKQGNVAALEQELRNAEKSGRMTEDQLGMLANIQLKKNDKVGYVNTIEKLATSYPKAQYWTDLLNRVQGKPGFSSRLRVDVYRLQLANGLLKKPSEFMEMAQLVLQAKAPAEALKIIDRGYKAGALGTGTDAPRHQRLKDLAEKNLAEQNKNFAALEAEYTAAKDNDQLVGLGYALVQAGQADKGLKMMEAAIKAGGLKYADEAKLRLGEAYAVAGKKQQAISTLKTVGGKEGTADLARYWIMAINKPLA
ncbi:lipopolysaccharide assembly protein LapB [Massilia sp. YIM B02443]|uniref:tetratricopeptide repeat protein n=1 Tax=Massilia sp. YIM B02443 TaxID=3050127 RepID=UPI0025B6C8E9|nr:tetratricopeptide repeat protein [Massilia sp. YIM B02443]MDN4035701.1 tetratricopeptide repeat protein [Massilia sp. YIM B02443]